MKSKLCFLEERHKNLQEKLTICQKELEQLSKRENNLGQSTIKKTEPNSDKIEIAKFISGQLDSFAITEGAELPIIWWFEFKYLHPDLRPDLRPNNQPWIYLGIIEKILRQWYVNDGGWGNISLTQSRNLLGEYFPSIQIVLT